MNNAPRPSIAESPPNELARKLLFWACHKDYMASLLLVLPFLLWRAATGTGGEAVDGLGQALNVAFLLLFLLLAALSILSSIRSLAEIFVDRSIAQVVERSADNKLKFLQSNAGSTVDLASLEGLLPANASQPAMLRFAQQLLKEAQDRRFDSRFHLIQAYRSESHSGLLRLERYQTYALRLGILGTFIGLMLALGTFTGILGDPAISDSTQTTAETVLVRQESLFHDGSKSLVQALAICFGTSIDGLLVAMFVAGQAEVVRRHQSLYFREMEGAALSLVSLASRSHNRDDLSAGLFEVGGELRRSSERYRTLGTAIQVSNQRLDAQTEVISKGMERLSEARMQFDGLLAEMGQSQGRFLKEFRAVYDAAALAGVFRQIERSIAEIEAGVANEVKTASTGVATRFGELTGKILAMEREIAHAAQDLAQRTSALQTSVGKIETGIAGAAAKSIRTIEGLNPILKGLEERATSANSGGLVVLDAPLFRKVAMSTSVGLVLGLIIGSGGAVGAVIGAVAAPGLVLGFDHFGRRR